MQTLVFVFCLHTGGMALGGYESTTSAHKRLSDEHDLGYDATKRFCQLSPRQTCTGSA